MALTGNTKEFILSAMRLPEAASEVIADLDEAAASATLADGKVYIGNASNVATGVVLSGDATIINTGAITIAAGAVTRAKASTAAGSKIVQIKGGTIATTSATDEYIIVPESGSLSSIEINPLVALTADDTNYITFTVTNLGQAGAGTTVMLAASAANTTQATGGTGLAINTKRALTVHGTAGNLVVVQGDKLKITATATGTLANTVTVPIYCARFSGTT